MTLTQTATLTKRALLLTIITIVLAISSWTGYQYYYYNYYLPNLPKIEEKPEVKWGKLPRPKLTETLVSSSNFSYSIDNATGSLPQDLPKILRVYFMPKLSTTLLAPDRARTISSGFGFNIGPDILSSTEFRFTDSSDGEFIIDLNTGNFNFARNIATDSASLGQSALQSKEKLGSDFKNYVSTKGLLKNQLTQARHNAVYNKNTQAESSSAIVSLWQNDVDNIPIVTPKYTVGTVKAVASKFTVEDQKYISMDYAYWEIDTNTFTTYPLKKIAIAFDELKQGHASVVIDPKTSKVSLYTAYIAYLQTEEYTPYLQPVYVFEGENFAALVPAISSEYSE